MEKPDTQQWLQSFPSLAAIQGSEWEDVVKSVETIRLQPGQSVFRSGESCERYLLVIKGLIRVQKISEDGHEITLYHVKPGQVCQLTTSCLLAQKCYPAEAIAETEVAAAAFPKSLFEKALAHVPPFRAFVYSQLEQGFNELIALVEEVAFVDAHARLAQCLIQRTENKNILLTTHQTLAMELGTAREVVSRLLKTFERQGLVRLHRGKIEILDKGSLCSLTKKKLCD